MSKQVSKIVGKGNSPGERGYAPQLPSLSWAGGAARGNAHVAVMA